MSPALANDSDALLLSRILQNVLPQDDEDDGPELPPLPPPPDNNNTTLSTTSTTTKHSHVNGKGLWRSWQRSFRQPVDALLDLVDNAFDANKGQGRIRISTTAAANTDQTLPQQQPQDDDNDANENDDGILLLNSFPETVYKDMSEILEVFKSEKDDLAIGENGVGIKQASASLSDFSVVVTKKTTPTSTIFQLGLLCASLQKTSGVEIPSFTMTIDNTNDTAASWDEELDRLKLGEPMFDKCLQYLGGETVPPLGNDDDDKDEDNFAENETATQNAHFGKDRLLQLLKHVATHPDWEEYPCVFALWVDALRTNDHTTSFQTLERLRSTLPKQYLHLQRRDCDIQINGKEPEFQYWERRLVDLTCFPIAISKLHPLGMNPEVPPQDELNTHKLRVFVGFDPVRASGFGQSSASLYIYSRKCGRLVKHEKDCRGKLRLTSGGTQYSQGLTILLDDPEASLPLTPTKQDIAWSDGPNGRVHEKNVMEWLKGFTKLYYDHILAQHFGSQKGELNQAVKEFAETVRETWIPTTEPLVPLSEFRSFSRFSGVQWSMMGDKLRISPTSRTYISLKRGEATVMQMDLPTPQQDASKKRRSSAVTLPLSSSARIDPFAAEPVGSSSALSAEPPKKKRGRPRNADRVPSPGGFQFGNSVTPAAASAAAAAATAEYEEQIKAQAERIASLEADVAKIPGLTSQIQTLQEQTTKMPALEDTVQSLRSDNQTLTERVSTLQKQAQSQSAVLAENHRLAQQVVALKKQVSELQGQRTALQQAHQTVTAQVVTLNQEAQTLTKRNQELQDQVAKLERDHEWYSYS